MVPKSSIPDMKYINRKVPIVDVARALDLRLEGATMVHCWHPARHQHGDRTASASILTSSNKIKCFVCNFRPKGPVDFVMDVLEISSPADAALWIAARFAVPMIAAHKHLAGSARRGERVQSGLALMIRSGLWAELSPAAQAIAPVLLEIAERDPAGLGGIERGRLDAAPGWTGARQAGAGDGLLYDDAILRGVAGDGPGDGAAGEGRNCWWDGVAGAPPKGARAHVRSGTTERAAVVADNQNRAYY